MKFYEFGKNNAITLMLLPGTIIHIFYAVKMGKKYEKRCLKYFKAPDIIRHNYEHEELLMCFPEKWVGEIKRCTGN